MNKEGFFEIPWQTTCNRNISYNCLDATIAWSENRRSGNRVVEIENFVSSHAGKHSIHDKPVSNSSTTPTSLTSVNNGVHHLSLRTKRKINSWKYSFNSFKWFLNWSENFGKTSFNFWFLFCFWVVLRGFEKKYQILAYRLKHGRCSKVHILTLNTFSWIISSIYIGMHWHKVTILCRRQYRTHELRRYGW